MNVHKGWACPRGIYSEVHSPITTAEIICVIALTLQPIRGCPQHSGETGTRLSSAIHRRLLSRFFLREGERLYTGYSKQTDLEWSLRQTWTCTTWASLLLTCALMFITSNPKIRSFTLDLCITIHLDYSKLHVF